MMTRISLFALLLLGVGAPARAAECTTVPGPACPCSAPLPVSGFTAVCDGAIPDGVNQLTARLTVPADHCGGAAIDAASVRVKIVHQAIGDLKITLGHPSGASVVLLNRLGMSAETGDCSRDDLDVTFADSGVATTGICDLTIPALHGTVRPAAALAALAGLPASGDWSLTVQDLALNGVGALVSWAVDLPCPAIPQVTIAATAPNARAGGASGRFTLTRNAGIASALTVDYSVGGSAPTSSYLALPGTVTFLAGEANAVIDVVATAAPSTAQTVSVTLTDGGARYTVGNPGSAVVTIVQASCGDGLLDDGEACDDGNTVEGDACLNNCQAAACGDGVLGPGEQCDDGNADDTDYCLAICALPRCGDALISRGEECDDGNLVNDDACTNSCRVPPPVVQPETPETPTTPEEEGCGCGCSTGATAPGLIAWGLLITGAAAIRRRRG